MSDPYGRNKMPEPTPKPRLFSPLRPLKGIFLLFLFGVAYAYNLDEWQRTFPGPPVVSCINCLPTLVLCFWLGWWGIAAPFVTWFLLLLLHFALHLDKEETLEYWQERLNL
jgi:hypothetical protein